MPFLRPARNSSGPALPLSAFYAASFLVTGIQLPFWPVWLAGRGLGPQEIALVFAAAIWVKVFATPAIGALADRLGQHRPVMLILAGTAFTGYAALWPASGFAAVLALNLVAATAQGSLMPLGDSITLGAVRNRRIDYGRTRVWGSLSFVVGAVGSGAVLAVAGSSDPGADLVLPLILAASALLWLSCLAIPAPAAVPVGASRWAALGALVADRRFWLFVATAAALQSSHQLYYGFGSLYWRSLGFSDAVIGVLWGEAVVAEIALFWYGGRLVAMLGPLGLMGVGGLAGVLRWGLAGILPGLEVAAALQLLHALTFGACHLGAMHFLARTVPPAAAASAQALYAGLSAGIGSGLVMLGAGMLYAAIGGQGYLFMALLSALGTVGVLFLRRMPRG